MQPPTPEPLAEVRTGWSGGLRVTTARLDPAALPGHGGELAAALAARGEDGVLQPVALPVFAATRYEVELVAAELASSDGYLNGLPLPPGAPVVIDVGAHVGLFSLEVLRRWPDARVVAVEPFGPSWASLRRNAELYGSLVAGRIEPVRAAVGAAPGETALCGSRGAATLASTAPGADQEVIARSRKSILTGLQRILRRGSWDASVAESAAQDVLAWFFEPAPELVPMITVADVLQERAINQVALLKVDVEGAELDVLDGVGDAWPRIGAVALETDLETAPAVLECLRDAGYAADARRAGFVTQRFAQRSVLVRARRTSMPVHPTDERPPADPWGGAVGALEDVVRRLPPGTGGELLDLYVDRSAGPLLLPWPRQQLRAVLEHGTAWVRHLLSTYDVDPGDPRAITRLLGGRWPGPRELGTVDVAAAVAARAAAGEVVTRLVRADVGRRGVRA